MENENKFYTPQQFRTLTAAIAKAEKDFNFVVFVGAGVSLSQGFVNWGNYIKYLAQYWQFHIHEYKKVSQSEIKVFDEILASSWDFKRKADLISTFLENKLGDKFLEIKLEFEKNYFEKIEPNNPTNKILSELVRLDAIFITTNYDFEIEKHIKNIKQGTTTRSINNLKEFSEKGSILSTGDILHIHGTTKGDPLAFIKSSRDYSRQYSRSKENFEELQKWFEQKNPVVLFVGSSMEETEVLSLLPENSKSFALLKSDGESELFRALISDSYSKENGATIFWFGDDFDDLPNEISIIVSEVQKINEVPEVRKDFQKLLLDTEDNEYQNILMKYRSDRKFLSELVYKISEDKNNKSQAIKLLNNLLNDKEFYSELYKLDNFWNIILNNFEETTDTNKKSIISYLKTTEVQYYFDSIYEVYELLVDQKILAGEELQEVQKNICKSIDLVRTSFANDKDMMGYWFVEQTNELQNYNRDLYIGSATPTINLQKGAMLDRLVINLNQESGYKYQSLKSILFDRGWSFVLIKLLFQSLKDKRLLLDNEEILEVFPEKLLDVFIFQRLLVYLDNENSIPKNLVSRLISKIDFSNRIFGSELVLFSENHKIEIEQLGKEIQDKYIDAIGEVHSGFVRQESFVSLTDILEKPSDKLAELLLSSEDESLSDSLRDDWLRERTIESTSNFLLSCLEKDDEVAKKVEYLISNHGKELIQRFEKLFVDLAINSQISQNISAYAKQIYLENFKGNKFDFADKTFFKNYIDNKIFDDNKVFEKLLSVDVNLLNHDIPFIDKKRAKVVELNDFINTEQGRFLFCIIDLTKKTKKFNDKIKIIIKSIEFIYFKEFAQGAIFELYEESELGNITENIFQGYSVKLRGFEEKDKLRFIPVAKQILEKGMLNEVNQINIFLLALYGISPETLENTAWEDSNYHWLIEIILSNEYQFKYEKEWLVAIFENDNNAKYLNYIFNGFAREQIFSNKRDLIVKTLKEVIEKYPAKAKIDMIPYKADNLENNGFEKYKEVLFLLLDSGKVETGYFGSNPFNEILSLMSVEERKKLLTHKNINLVLSNLELENFKNKFI